MAFNPDGVCNFLPLVYSMHDSAGIPLISFEETGTATDELHRLMISAAMWVCIWVVLFYCLSNTYLRWSSAVAPSTKPHENNKFYCARNILGIIHATVVGIPSFVVLLVYFGSSPKAKFAVSDHVATCSLPGFAEYDAMQQTTALAGLMFTTFTLADLIVGSIHGLNTWDYIWHHISFIGAGVLFRGNCMLPFNGAALLAMEVSTPFLNWMIFFRHRGASYKTHVVVSGVLFLLTYIVFRIIINIYATLVLIIFVVGNGGPENVPRWQTHLLIVAVVSGAILQLFWLPKIWEAFADRIRALICGRQYDVTDQDGDLTDTQQSLLRPEVKAFRSLA